MRLGENEGRFWVRDGGMCPLLVALGPHLYRPGQAPAHALSASVLHMCVDSVDLEGRVSLLSSVSPGTYTLLASSSAGFLGLRGKGFDEDILLRTECSTQRSCIFGIMSDCESLYLFPSAAGGSFSDDG